MLLQFQGHTGILFENGCFDQLIVTKRLNRLSNISARITKIP
jgi:hypothetical protein